MVLLAFLALAVILQLLRIGPSSALNSLWAEDGPVFLERAMTHDLLSALATPWSGYLVVTQSLIGEIGALAPLRDAPAVMNLAAALVVALSGLAIWFAGAAHIRSPYLRALLVALMVLVPVGSIEMVASPTNVSWYMAVAVFWLLLWRPATILGASLSAGLILLTGFSTLLRPNRHPARGSDSRSLVPLITSFGVDAGDARGGPQWDDSLKAAAGSCEARHLDEIPVYTAPAGWTMNISCPRLIAAEGGGQAP